MLNNVYRVYVCIGDRESGSYTAHGLNYVDAATDFGNHWNTCGLKKYGSKWDEAGQKPEGMPKEHMYLTDELGNKLLLMPTGEKTTFGILNKVA